MGTERLGYKIEDHGYDTPCWIWQGALRNDYGQITIHGRNGRTRKTTVQAHVWYYERSGKSVANGLVLDHLCRVKACVNPDHMEPKTQAENVKRELGRLGKITEDVADAIKNDWNSGRYDRVNLAKKYGISKSSVYNVLMDIGTRRI